MWTTSLRPAGRDKIAFALAGIVLVLYLPARHYDFVFDDTVYVTLNRAVREGLTPAGCRWALTSLYAGHWHPLTWLSHMLDVSLYGLEPGGHHATNIALHAANSALVFLVLSAATRRRTRSAVVAGLFAVHPLHVESVAWIADRKDLLAAFFSLLSMAAYLRWAGRRVVADYLAALLFFFLAVGSKSMAVALPLAFLVLDVWPLARLRAGIRMEGARVAEARDLLLEKAPFFTAGLAIAWLTSRAAAGVSEGFTPSPWPLAIQFANAVIQCATYALQTIVPHRLAVLYPVNPHPAPGAFGISLAALAVVTSGAIALRKRAPYLAAGWAWFLLMLLPVMGLVPFGPMSPADRYMYLPILGLLVMIAWGAADLLAPHRAMLRVLAVSATITLAVSARQQLASWATPEALFSRAREVNPENPLVYRELAIIAMTRDDDRAMSLEREALALDPRFVDAHYDLGLLLAAHGRFEEAASEFREVVRMKPGSALSWYYMGQALKCGGDPAESDACLARARALKPSVEKDARSPRARLLENVY